MLSKLQVLVIDKDPLHVATVAHWLHESGYDSASAEDGLSGLRRFFDLRSDIVVVDLDLQEMPGWQVVERIREIVDTPIMVTASHADAESLRKGFDLEVSGFLVKPLKKRDFVGRLNIIREKHFNGDNGHRWHFQRNGLQIDWRSCEVSVHGEPVPLTAMEFKLLAYLVEYRGWVLSHEQILSHVWGMDYAGDLNQVRLYIWYLRRKIEEDPRNPKFVVTKRGLGYSFAA